MKNVLFQFQFVLGLNTAGFYWAYIELKSRTPVSLIQLFGWALFQYLHF